MCVMMNGSKQARPHPADDGMLADAHGFHYLLLPQCLSQASNCWSAST